MKIKPLDKTEQFDKLSEVETDVGKRDVRESRRRIKQLMHKHARTAGKRELRRVMEGENDD
jgi:hypothetical protein